MPKIRILIVDDSVVVRKMLTEALSLDPDIEVVGTASNGQIGLARVTQFNPDLITLDVAMPVMDGLKMLAELRKTHEKLPVIMFSLLTERGAEATLDALSLGASDYVTKPANAEGAASVLQQVRTELIPKIKALCPSATLAPAARPSQPEAAGKISFHTQTSFDARPEVLAIGVSTGGPNALLALLPALARNFPAPVVIVQHMPPLFTRLLAERLGAASGFNGREGTAGAMLQPGDLWIAPGGFHMEVNRTPEGVRLRTHEEPPENSCRPAVDVLFRSVARAYGARALAVILTGMGQDGLRGCENIREARGQILAQDEASSVVWGMPGAVVQAGLAHKVLPLAEMATEINRRFQTSAALAGPARPNIISTTPAMPKAS